MADKPKSVSGAAQDKAGLAFAVQNAWDAGFTAEITVSAGGTALNEWVVEFDSDFEITSLWNARIVSHTGPHYVIANAAWNGAVGSGGTVSFGFQAASGPAGAVASSFVLNGTATEVATPPETELPTLAISGIQFAEGDAQDGGSGLFTVTLSAASDKAVTVAWKTEDGTAQAGSDYTAASGTLTFAPGETSKTIRIDAIGDSRHEGNEAFTITLSSANGAAIATASATGTIVDDDKAVDPAASRLSTSGNQIVNAAGQAVQIAGVNWFGFEADTMAPHGLWARGYKDMMDQMAELGFNTIRLPFSSEMLHATALPGGIDYSKNPDLAGLTPIEVMDRIVAYADEIGMRIILDHHRSESGTGTSANGLWYNDQYSEKDWIADWQMLAARYAGNASVIGADLHNEPYNGTWGDGGVNDWARAATAAGDAIGAVNPGWLIFVEGISVYEGNNYWWGGNLMGVRDHPITLKVANKLVYSAHDYPNSVHEQPWFEGSDFAAGLPAKFTEMWGYIFQEGIAPVYVGEFGTKLVDPKDAAWLDALTAYLGGDFNNDGKSDLGVGQTGPAWTYWSWNPNSGDTGGILKDDWTTMNENKLAYLDPLLPAAGSGDPLDTGGTLTGSAKADLLNVAGATAAFLLRGLGGNDTLKGGAGNDTLEGGAGADSIDGGSGSDTLSYSASKAAITFSLMTGKGRGGDAEGDSVTGVETVIGSAFADRITGNAAANALRGGNGNDSLSGGAGDDALIGGAGADIISGGSGNDTLSYSASKAAITFSLATGKGSGGDAEGDSVTGVENVTGSAFADRITGNDGANALHGQDGNDTLIGSGGADTLSGGNGNDSLSGGAGNDSLIGGAGADSIDGGSGSDILSYSASKAAITISLATGKGSGGDAQGDRVSGVETVIGSAFADRITGDDAANALSGGSGNDTLSGGAGNDTLTGGAGNDSLIGGAGADSIDGGSGSDILSYSASKAAITISLATGKGSGGDAQGDRVSGVETVIGSAFADRITGDDAANALSGGSGNDTLSGGAGNDTLTGGAGNDSLIGGAGADSIDGGSGSDILSYSASKAAITISLATGKGSGGDAQGDRVSGVETVIGSAFADRITGDDAANALSGGSGNDTLSGGAGNDTLTGGTGADIFLFATPLRDAGIDRITDFSVADDTLQLDNAVFTALGAAGRTLAAAAFNTGPAATDALDRILYDPRSGILSYDADGSGAGTATQIAKLSTGLSLDHDDFFIV